KALTGIAHRRSDGPDKLRRVDSSLRRLRIKCRGRRRFIVHLYQRAGVSGLLERRGDDERHRLAGIVDPIVLKRQKALSRRTVFVPWLGCRGHPRQISVSEDRQHACLFRCAGVDRFDAPICDRALNNYRAYGARTANVGRVCGATADFKVTICAWDRLSDGAHARPPAIVSARRATRWASSTLNPLCPSGRASLNEAAMAILSVPISSSLAPRSAASADVSRHGLWATPPNASRTERMRPWSTATAAAAETSANS